MCVCVCCMFQYYLHYSYLINARLGPRVRGGGGGGSAADNLRRPRPADNVVRCIVAPFKNAVVHDGLSVLHTRRR